MPKPWSLKVETSGDQTKVRFEGASIYFDEETSAAVREQLFALLEKLPPGDLFLDFANVSFLTSTGHAPIFAQEMGGPGRTAPLEKPESGGLRGVPDNPPGQCF